MLHFADFALQEQLEVNLMLFISRAWYNGSYTMAAKPIKSLELHYTMIQFLIMTDILWPLSQSNSRIALSNDPVLRNNNV